MDGRRGIFLAWVSATLVLLLSALSLCAAIVVARADPPKDAPGNHALSLLSGGQKRTFLVHVPTGYAPGAKPLSVVVMLHGAGGDGAQAMAQTGWDTKADKENFLAVFPDALPARPDAAPSFLRNPRFWEDGSGRGKRQVDDAAFIAAVLDDVARQFPVDSRRVYVTGFSSGASMTFTLAARLSERFAAAAPVSGHFWLKNTPPPAHLVPLLLIYGKNDPLDPWDGGMARNPWMPGGDPKPKVMETVSGWAKLMGCPPEAVVITDKNGVKRVVYGPGKSGVEMGFITIEGAGHTWPGGKESLLPRLVGARTDKLKATDTIWEFFSRHVRAVRSVSP